jgi:hypothetical protein
MAADTVKSASITNLDAAPQNATASNGLTEGVGAAGRLNDHSDYVTMTTGGLASTSSTYKMVRLSTQSIIKSARLFTKSGLDSSTGLQVDLGAYYSDSTIDGTPPSLQGTSISTNCFVAAQAFGQSSAGSDINALSNLDANLRTSPLWQQVGLTSDPGGYIDLVLAVHQVASGTATAGNVVLNVSTVN